MNKLIIGLSLLLQFFACSAFAEQNSSQLENQKAVNADAQALAKILANTLTFEASFEQSVYRENSDQAETTLGRFLIQRPNHFRWQTKQPFEQAIIADGLVLWTYDPELEQVNIQDQQSVLTDSPLLLLTSSIDQLVKSFEIVQIEGQEDKNRQLFALTPRENGLFESVHILIRDQKITEFFLLDTLGGRTSVVFSEIKLNQGINVKEFMFSPPEGIDVIDSRALVNE